MWWWSSAECACLSFRHCSRRCSALGFLSCPSPAVASSSLSSSSSSPPPPPRIRCLGLSGAAALGPSQFVVAPNSCSARRLLRLSSSVSFYSAIGCDPPARLDEDLPPPAMAPPTDAAFTVATEHDGSVSEEHVPAAAVEDTRRRSFQIVVAATRERGIGKDGQLPWKLPTDMNFFKTVTSLTTSATKKNAVVMGRRTWESIPDKFRPLRGRLNVVLTRSSRKSLGISPQHENVLVSDSFDSALALLAAPPLSSEVESVFVIGGGQVYSEAMNSPLCDAIHVTEIDSSFQCDTFMPAVDTNLFRVWSASFPAVENGIRFSFVTYVRNESISTPSRPSGGKDGVSRLLGNEESPLPNIKDMAAVAASCTVQKLPRFVQETHEEYQYLNLIQDIILNGAEKGDRTGTGTLSKFGCQMRFNLRKSFPLLTTKNVFWRGVVEELLWFISGSTNAKVLQEKGIHIWDGNASRSYLDSQGLKEREEGDLGPVYGFQWRHFGARYTDMHADYSGQGFDQLADVIHKIRTNPDDRRILLSAWNPADLEIMALPPCHMFAQFYVADGELSCQMYQRSCDMGLGVPFNIASYALLTCLIAHVCDLVPGDFIHVLGDAHVYKNHVEPLQAQLKNTPKPFPVLQIKSRHSNIDLFTANDFELIGYQPHKRITMKMAV
ncbi:unnamed protein product [Sphagnum jensenii]|uniref:DHFR domain-containing protein n=1 Tax=Sphagnum jensenii TaxID=128206 RepID=A0ABP1A5D1_9BRYO